MDKSSLTPFPVDNSTAFPDHQPLAGNQSEVLPLNKSSRCLRSLRSLRKVKPETMLPYDQARGDHYQSKSLASFQASRHLNPAVSVSQKQAECTGNEPPSSDQPQATHDPIAEKGEQVLSGPEQSTAKPSAKTPERVKQELQNVIDDLFEYLVQLGARPESK